MKEYHIAIVGVSGIVGQTVLKLLKERNVAINKLSVYGSSNSAGKKINFKDQEITIIELNEANIDPSIDVVIMAAGNEIAIAYAPLFIANGSFVVDNSSAFRNDCRVPLVIPEINVHCITNQTKLIANPNCTTTQGVFPLKVIDDLFKLKRVDYTSYQAVSGSGVEGIIELSNTRKGLPAQLYPYEIAQNLIPLIDTYLDNGFSKEEVKMINETIKILELCNVAISATCVRVPIENTHALSITIETKEEIDITLLKDQLSLFQGLVLLDDPAYNVYPVASIANGNDDVYVGRVRKDLYNPKVVHLYCVSDNIRKGAATNS
ncbi:MAG: aspartate-semialdehyde dehydrogenase, partial [Bacilli bacterium]